MEYSARRAFTLIELLVTITIIMVLISISITGVMKSMRLARDSACKTNVRSLAVACNAYMQDYRWLPPGQYDMDVPMRTHLYDSIKTYLTVDRVPSKTERIAPWTCPLDNISWTLKGVSYEYYPGRYLQAGIYNGPPIEARRPRITSILMDDRRKPLFQDFVFNHNVSGTMAYAWRNVSHLDGSVTVEEQWEVWQ